MVCSLVWCMHPTDADYRPCSKKRRERVLNGRKHTPRREHSQNTGLTPKSRHFIHSLLPRLLSLYSKWPTISKPTLPTGAALGPPAFLSVGSSPLSSLMGRQSARVEPVSHAIHTLPSWAGSGHQPVLLSAFASVSVFIFQCVGGRAPRESWVSREDATKNIVAFLKS